MFVSLSYTSVNIGNNDSDCMGIVSVTVNQLLYVYVALLLLQCSDQMFDGDSAIVMKLN
jgi:hypothetical protein